MTQTGLYTTEQLERERFQGNIAKSYKNTMYNNFVLIHTSTLVVVCMAGDLVGGIPGAMFGLAAALITQAVKHNRYCHSDQNKELNFQIVERLIKKHWVAIQEWPRFRWISNAMDHNGDFRLIQLDELPKSMREDFKNAALEEAIRRSLLEPIYPALKRGMACLKTAFTKKL